MLGCFQQTAGIPLRVACAEHGITGNQQLGSRFDDAGYGIVSDATVYLNPITEAQFTSKFF